MMTAQTESKSNQSRVRRILIVDDHPIMRHGIRQLIDGEEDLSVCGEAATAQEALVQIDELKPDLVTIDISLTGSSGIELIKDVRNRHGDLPILVLSMHDESLYSERSLRAGANGYVTKQAPPEAMVEAIRRVLEGDIYISDAMASKLARRLFERGRTPAMSPIECLTDRELEVFRLIGEGRTTREAAQQLHISVKTVGTYCGNIKEKLGLKNANELIQHAVQWVQTEGAA